jgi:hypothetical protein
VAVTVLTSVPVSAHLAVLGLWGRRFQLFLTVAGLVAVITAVLAGAAADVLAADYFNAMVERYPDRLGRTVLWATAQAVFGIREHPGEDPTQFIAAGWL